MIDGERGHAMLEQMIVLRTAGIIDGDAIEVSLVAAVLTHAMRCGRTPREVAVDLWDMVPSDDDWEVARDKLEEAMESLEERGL